MKNEIDKAVEAETFRGKALFKDLVPLFGESKALLDAYRAVTDAWGKRTADETLLGIVRWSFLIELVKKPKIETTKFETRWAKRLGHDDPRYATFDECLDMCIVLANEAAASGANGERRTLVEAFIHHNLVPYELPLDYRRRVAGARLHTPDNVEWLWGGHPAQDGAPSKLPS